jgi:hypothetical protein
MMAVCEPSEPRYAAGSPFLTSGNTPKTSKSWFSCRQNPSVPGQAPASGTFAFLRPRRRPAPANSFR